ncbi:hypothetical protein GCM10009743_17160 [Kribbella swartbergensis]
MRMPAALPVPTAVTVHVAVHIAVTMPVAVPGFSGVLVAKLFIGVVGVPVIVLCGAHRLSSSSALSGTGG